MSNLTPMLQYQESELALKRIERELAKNPAQISSDKALAAFKAAKKTVDDNEEAAAKIVAFYQKVLAEYKEFVQKSETLVAELEKIAESDEEARKAKVAEMESMRSRMVNVEKRLLESKASADAIVKSSTEARNKQKKLKEDYTDLAKEVDKVKAKYAPEIEKHTALMKKLEKEVDSALWERYKRLAADNKYPPLGEAKIIDKSYYCFCGMELSGAAKEELLQNKQCVCGSCSRIVYQK